jgi:hypothetical protein
MKTPLYLSKYENEVTFDPKSGNMVYIVRVWYEAAYDRFQYIFTKQSENDEGSFKIHKLTSIE